jgi:hypothetical protein
MFRFSRILIAYALAAPLALVLGYLVVWPGKFSFTVIGMVLLFLALPLFLKWHHTLLVTLWSSAFVLGFFGGQPQIWLVVGLASFGVSMLNHIIVHKRFLHAPELTRPLLFLGAVVLFTAWYRGGIGIRALGGSSYGGKYYYLILVAIAGYFAFTSEALPVSKGVRMGQIYFFAGTSYALPNVAFTLGPAFYFLFYIVPTEGAMTQAANAMGIGDIDRIEGLAPAATAGVCFFLARYGIRNLFDWTKPWRAAFFLLTILAGGLAGFRSCLMMIALLFGFQFYFEGLLRTHYLPIVVAFALFGFLPVVFFSEKMPTGVQRAISFLPVNVNSEILADAKDSSEWRVGMWTIVAKDIPKYFWIGKGYAINPDELAAVSTAQLTGIELPPFEGPIIAGDYHSGPLSLIIPFGIFGTVAFLWMLYGGTRVLWLNYRYGDPRLKKINTTILAFFVTQSISFFILFGAMNTQLYVFLGLCGLSVSLNGGVRRRVQSKTQPLVPQTRTLAADPG